MTNHTKIDVVEIPDNCGARDFDANTTVAQVGRMNLFATSGGRVNILYRDRDAVEVCGERQVGVEPVGVEFPVSSGYRVRVFLGHDDTYTVQRVWRKVVKGYLDGVYCDELGEAVYQAGCYRSNAFGDHAGSMNASA